MCTVVRLVSCGVEWTDPENGPVMAFGCAVLLLLLLPLATARGQRANETCDQPQVCAPQAGCVRGKLMAGYQSDSFEAFLGIPYALPPLAELRFSNPRPYPVWSGVLDATLAKADCIQKNYLLPNPVVYGSEDCLYLNVYRPTVHSSAKLPVMVYIHGGGWFSGSVQPGLIGPEYLMDSRQVIVVTFSYRLGALGFLSTGDRHASGNFGLKDQRLALRWVQQNIAAFGGDPKSVTLFGQSAGAVSAHLHMLSERSRGLFRGVIAMSGTANVPFAINDQPLRQARLTAQLCNITDADRLSPAKLVRVLRSVDAETVVRAGDGLKYWNVDHLTNYRPVVEAEDASEPFLTQHPEQLLAAGEYSPVAWMAGRVPNEGAVRAVSILESPSLIADFNRDFRNLLETLLELPEHLTRPQLDRKMQLIIDEYFQGRRAIDNDTAQGFIDLVTDRGFHYPYYSAIRAYVRTADTERHPVSLYTFAYRGPYSFADIFNGGPTRRDYGVVHCDDLIYVFRAPLLFPDFERDSVDAHVVRVFVESLVHFAKFGRPLLTESVKPCSRSSFASAPDAICDYQRYENAPSASFAIRTDNAFNVRRMKLWDAILEHDAILGAEGEL